MTNTLHTFTPEDIDEAVDLTFRELAGFALESGLCASCLTTRVIVSLVGYAAEHPRNEAELNLLREAFDAQIETGYKRGQETLDPDHHPAHGLLH